MKKPFDNLAEFEALRDDERIDLHAIAAALDRLHFQKLNGVFSNFVLLRKFRVRQWIRELKKVSLRPITLEMTRREIIPHMQENGVIRFCKKDVRRADKLFMLLAHETAHFLLMQDRNYPLIKKVDREYRAMPGREQAMRAPVEACANKITLLILERCHHIEKKQKSQKRIEICIKTLKNQLTK